MVVMKTPAATAMAGAQIINNQLKGRKRDDSKTMTRNEEAGGGGGSAVTAREWRPVWQQWQQLGKSLALAEAAAW